MATMIENVSSSDVMALIKTAQGLGADVEQFEGSLLDHYILTGTEQIDVEQQRGKYIVARETYQNQWESDYTLILTDDENEVEQYRNDFED